MTRRRANALVVAGVVAAGALVASVAALAISRGSDPTRCPTGMVALGARCCGEGQHLEQTDHGPRCAGAPQACARGLEVTAVGCVAPETRVVLPAGTLRIGPGDWEAAGIERREAVMPAFAIDAYEVTEARWQRCVEAGKCAPAAAGGGGAGEPGLPVTDKTLREAEALCAWAGGRLASANELAWAAAGAAGRRYPWGDTGAVCRRAVWAMVDGPCAHDARGPDLAGSRPDGASPEGVFDLAGNVAEWAQDEGGRAEVRGGTYRDEAAARLRSWNRRDASAELRSPEVGFRCTYAASPPAP